MTWNDAEKRLMELAMLPNEPGYSNPSQAALERAATSITEMRSRGLPDPIRVCPTSDGGIVFEFSAGSAFAAWEIYENGRGEYRVFNGTKLVSREKLE